MSFNNFKTALQALYLEQKDCDVTFACGDSTIMAHKLILSLASDVFYIMFYGKAAKHRCNKNEEKPIIISDIDMPTFKLLLR